MMKQTFVASAIFSLFLSPVITQADFNESDPYADLTLKYTTRLVIENEPASDFLFQDTEPTRTLPVFDVDAGVKMTAMLEWDREDEVVEMPLFEYDMGETSTDAIVLDLINENYYGYVSAQVRPFLDQYDAQEMVAMLEDPYSEYFSADMVGNSVDPFGETQNGVGIYLAKYEKEFYVYNVIEGASAAQSFVPQGGKILSVNKVPLTEMSTAEVRSMIQGENGTYVKIDIEKDGSVTPFVLQRQEYTLKNVVLSVENDVAFLTLKRFDMPSVEAATRLLKNEVYGAGVTKVVLDLRDNEGGALSAAVAFSELFTQPGEVLFQTKNNKHETTVYTAKEAGLFDEKADLVILQNGETASAAEVFIALMQDTGRATVVGSPSNGKREVQEVFLIQDGSLLKLTVAEWQKASGEMIDEAGIVPDVYIWAGGMKTYLKNGDRQKKTAFDFINSL